VDFDADIYSPSDVAAYIATSIDQSSGIVTLTPLEGYIPAGTGVVLRYTASTSDITLVTATSTSAASTDGNLLIGAAEQTIFSDSGYTYYILTKKNGKGGFYFQNKVNWSGTSIADYEEGTAVVCAANKAVLRISGDAGVKGLSIQFADEADAIEAVTTDKAADGAIYDLSGRRVSAPVRGIYIQNGKKMIVK